MAQVQQKHFQNPAAWQEAQQLIQEALVTGATELSLSGLRLRSIPKNIIQLKHQLTSLNLGGLEHLTQLEFLADFSRLEALYLNGCYRLSSVSQKGGPLSKLTSLQQLDVSDCRGLTSLAGIAGLTSLQQLNVRGCRGLTRLAGIAGLTSLQQLNVSYLTSLEGIAELTSLQQLNVSGCDGLTNLEGIAELRSLQQLDVGHCRGLTSLEGIEGLTSIQQLNVRGCRGLTRLEGIAGLTSLQQLDVSHCSRLTSLEGIAELKSLQQLNVSHCRGLTSLKGIAELRSLQQLDVSVCDGLTSLEGIAELKSLQQLAVSDCRGLTSLEGIAGLRNLHQLDVSDCRGLTSLAGIEGLTSLQQLDVSGCDGLTNLEGIAELRSLQQLAVAHCRGLTSLEGIAELKSLQQLAVRGCRGLTSLEGIEGLTSLQQLAVRGCDGLTSLEDIARLTSLQQLDVSGCHELTSLAGIAGLRSLQQLDVSDCIGLTSLAGIEGLVGLQQLTVRHCSELTSLKGIAELTNLQHLNVIGCKELTSLAGIENLTRLQFVSASGCDALATIEYDLFEKWLLGFPYLQRILIDNVAISGVPSELTKGIYSLQALEDWYFDMQTGAMKINEVKLHLLGNGRVGKTQISRRLSGEDYDASISSTHGIKITNWPLTLTENQQDTKIDITNWDFGGQDVYLSTHSLFLDDRAVYCLLWHPDFENNDVFEENGVPMQNQHLSYWLAYIHSLAGSHAPVIVMQSRCDTALDDSVPPIPNPLPFTGFFKTTESSAKNADGLETCLPLIKRAVKHQLERNGEVKLPLSWWRVAETLLGFYKSGTKKISRDEYLAICQDDAKGSQVSAPDSLLIYLHNSGQVFYKSGLFNDAVILDQAWALAGVYSLLDRGQTLPALREQQGKFTWLLLSELLWDAEGYSQSEQALFLEMMQQCSICFKISEQHDSKGEGAESLYIAPDCLPEKERVGKQISSIWRNATANVQVSLDYEFLHDAVARQALCDIGNKAGMHALYWRYGCCFYDSKSDTTVLIDMAFSHQSELPQKQQIQQQVKNQSALSAERIEEYQKNYGQPGSINIQIAGEHAKKLAEHLVESILENHKLSHKPTVRWLLGKTQSPEEEKPEMEFNSQQQSENQEAFANVPEASNLPKVFMSYAWGKCIDNHQKVCDAICQALRTSENKYQLVIDKESLQTGDSIKAFEQNIGWAEHIIVIFSAKSLQSEDCMRELAYIKQTSKDEAHFKQRVIPIILDEVKIGTAIERAKLMQHWKLGHEELQALAENSEDPILTESLNLYRNIKDTLVSCLDWSNDILLNRDQDVLVEEGYQPIIELLIQRIEEKKTDQK